MVLAPYRFIESKSNDIPTIMITINVNFTFFKAYISLSERKINKKM